MVRIKAHKPLTVNKAAYREIPYLSVLIFFTQSHREFGGICDFSIYDLRLHLVILVALNDLRSNAGWAQLVATESKAPRRRAEL